MQKVGAYRIDLLKRNTFRLRDPEPAEQRKEHIDAAKEEERVKAGLREKFWERLSVMKISSACLPYQ